MTEHVCTCGNVGAEWDEIEGEGHGEWFCLQCGATIGFGDKLGLWFEPVA